MATFDIDKTQFPGIWGDEEFGVEAYVPSIDANSDNAVYAEAPPIPKWSKRLDETLKNFSSITDTLPYPVANPFVINQRKKLQKRADAFSYIQRKAPSPIVWSDNYTNQDLEDIWKLQKNQYIGSAYKMANPQTIDETNELAKAIDLSSDDWQEMLALHRDSRRDVVWEKNALDLRIALEDRNAKLAIPGIIQELVYENADTDDNGNAITTGVMPLVSYNDIRQRLLDYSALYKIPSLASSDSVKIAYDNYLASTPGVETQTWYSKDGFQSEEVDKRDKGRQLTLKGMDWTVDKPPEKGRTGLLGQQSIAMPTNTIVASEYKKDSSIYRGYLAAKKHFNIPDQYEIGSLQNLTLNTKADVKHFRALQSAGALNYKPSGAVQESVFIGPGGFETHYVSSNPVADRYYRNQARKVGGQVRMRSDAELAIRSKTGQLREQDKVKVLERQGKARDLYRLATKMDQVMQQSPRIFGAVGGALFGLQRGLGIAIDTWGIVQDALGFGTANQSVADAQMTSVNISNIIAGIREDDDLSEDMKAETIKNWEDMRTKVDDASSKLRSVGGFMDKLTGGRLASTQLAQLQIYELGMATQLARLWSTKDRLLKDIYDRALASASLFTGSSDQVKARLDTIKKLARQKIDDYDKQLNPQSISQQYTAGPYGHIKAYADEDRDAELKKKYGL